MTHSYLPGMSSQNVQSSISIQQATLDDLDAIVTIENRAYPFPWPRNVLRQGITAEEAFSYFFLGRLHETPKVPDNIVGYHYFWLVADEVHILNIAVDPVYQRRGYASQLLQFGLDFGWERGACSAFLEVRASNIAAQQFYTCFGFQRIGVRKAYYADSKEDAYVLKKWLVKTEG